METTAEFICGKILGCGQLDIEKLFGVFTENGIFNEALRELEADGMKNLSADWLWIKCVDIAVNGAFGTDVNKEIFDVCCNGISSCVSIGREAVAGIEQYEKKAEEFKNLSGFEIEVKKA